MNIVRVTYRGFDTTLDQVIHDALTKAGLTWYTQGHNKITGERDICFDYEGEIGKKT